MKMIEASHPRVLEVIIPFLFPSPVLAACDFVTSRTSRAAAGL